MICPYTDRIFSFCLATTYNFGFENVFRERKGRVEIKSGIRLKINIFHGFEEKIDDSLDDRKIQLFCS